jgi:hypothetical protein
MALVLIETAVAVPERNSVAHLDLEPSLLVAVLALEQLLVN